jgi:hypothetical protein
MMPHIRLNLNFRKTLIYKIPLLSPFAKGGFSRQCREEPAA